MKKIYSLCLFFALFAASNLAVAQQNRIQKINTLNYETSKAQKNMVGNEVMAISNEVPLAPTVTSRFGVEEIVGTTWYDLQSNGTSQTRFLREADGTMHKAWIFSQDQTGAFPDRGTGYTTTDGGDWGQGPDVKLEASARTGWPSISKTADGDVVIINHATSDSFRLHVLRLPAGSTTWEESDIPSSNVNGMLWPRSVAGGPDGNTIHAIGVTTPSGNTVGGVDNIYQGVNGHILYYRSLDGGVTWDKQNVVIPGIDLTEWTNMPSDGYSIDVQGSTVAIGVFSSWGDVAVAKSTDNGDNWEILVANDFPLSAYVTDAGYAISDIYPDGVLPTDIPFIAEDEPDSLAIRSSDNSGCVFIDGSDQVHVWYGEQWILDGDLTDATTSFYNGNDAMRYWNESMGEGNNIFFTQPIDANGDTTLNILTAEVADYGMAWASMPTAAIDADGIMYVAYSAVTENFFDEEDQQQFRHVYLMRSADNGATWTEPFDVITPEFVPEFSELNEAVFPSLARTVDDFIHLAYMRDYKPGLAVRGDIDPQGSNDIIYLEIQKDLVSGTEEVVEASEIGFKVFPNPASKVATLQIELLENTNVNMSVIDISGKVIRTLDYSNLSTGVHQKELNTSAFQNGTYFIQVRTDDIITMQKLVVLN